MSEHTPTPWRAEREYSETPPTFIHKDGIPIADCYLESAVGADVAAANAAFIVKAVNSHEALVKALADLLEHAESQGDFKNGVSHNGVDEGEVFAAGIFDAARAALALVVSSQDREVQS